MDVEIRTPGRDAVGRLTEIAWAAKRHWGYPTEWLEQWRDTLTITPADLEAFTVRAAAVEECLVGFYALSRADGETFDLEHMWVHPSAMGEGVGTALFEDAVEVVRERGGDELNVVSDPHAVGFYERQGARRVGAVESSIEGRSLPRLVLAVDGE